MRSTTQFYLVLIFALAITSAVVAERPNAILILTDDQGYGDVSAHGNPVLKTPNVDRLAKESVPFTDFHVAPMCSPTRGQLMTGMDAMKNGCTAAAAGDEPFFLYYCSPMVHLPHCPPDDFDGKKIKGQTPTRHLDMILDLEMQVKRMVNALKVAGEFENTLIVVTSDNGGLGDKAASKHGHQSNGGWNGNKNSPLEGGHRVPFFAVWPGRIEPGITDELAVNQDLVATLAALVGTEIPEGQAMDSNNLLPLLMGDGTFRNRNVFVHQAGSKNEVMIRRMPWKLIIQSNPKRSSFEPKSLFNLQDDPHEDANLISQTQFKPITDGLLKEYMEIVESGRPTVPGR